MCDHAEYPFDFLPRTVQPCVLFRSAVTLDLWHPHERVLPLKTFITETTQFTPQSQRKTAFLWLALLKTNDTPTCLSFPCSTITSSGLIRIVHNSSKVLDHCLGRTNVARFFNSVLLCLLSNTPCDYSTAASTNRQSNRHNLRWQSLFPMN